MNTTERAWSRLQIRYALPRTSFAFQIKRRIAPAGTVSDGTRVLTVEPCPSFRWIIAKDGTGKILAEVDQREHLDDPDAMIGAFHAQLDALETPKPQTKLGGTSYNTELTAIGEQTVIPGCERNISPKATQFDLFG
jgi:hypothetical protein